MVQILAVLAENAPMRHDALNRIVKTAASELYELGVEGFVRHSPGEDIQLTRRGYETAGVIIGDFSGVILSFPPRMPLAIFREIREAAIQCPGEEMRISIFTEHLTQDPKTIRTYLETLVVKRWLTKSERGGNFYWSLTTRGKQVLGYEIPSPTESRSEKLSRANRGNQSPPKMTATRPHSRSGGLPAQAPHSIHSQRAESSLYFQPDLFVEAGA